jgi:hypothetical protein
VTRLVWDSRPHNYQAGLDRGVFYSKNAPGEVWNGLIGINEDSTDIEEHSRHIDGVKIYRYQRTGHLSGQIEAVTYPESLHNDVFGRRITSTFGMSYRVMTATGYKLHLVYNVLLKPSSYVHKQAEVQTFNWDFSTTPVAVPQAKPTSHLVIDTSIAYSWTVEVLENILYGTDTESARLPLPEEIFEVFEENAILQIIDNGDGTWTAIGPDSVITMLDSDTFQIAWPSAVYIDADTYTISSL